MKHNFGNLGLDKNMLKGLEFEVVEFEENWFVGRLEEKLEFGSFEEFGLKEKEKFQRKLKDCLLEFVLLKLELAGVK